MVRYTPSSAGCRSGEHRRPAASRAVQALLAVSLLLAPAFTALGAAGPQGSAKPKQTQRKTVLGLQSGDSIEYDIDTSTAEAAGDTTNRDSGESSGFIRALKDPAVTPSGTKAMLVQMKASQLYGRYKFDVQFYLTQSAEGQQAVGFKPASGDVTWMPDEKKAPFLLTAAWATQKTRFSVEPMMLGFAAAELTLLPKEKCLIPAGDFDAIPGVATVDQKDPAMGLPVKTNIKVWYRVPDGIPLKIECSSVMIGKQIRVTAEARTMELASGTWPTKGKGVR